jgi:hypothetical protein
MDDREKHLAGLQEHLDSLSEEERAELEAFVDRFNAQVSWKIEQLLHEIQDPGRLSEGEFEMRSRLLDGYVLLVSDDGELIYRRREAFSVEDMRRFGRFMDADAARREREIGDLGDSSEN